jgi:hypothetical protein
MEVRVNDSDRNRIIQQLSAENAELKVINAALSRTITEMEMAQAAEAEAEEKPQKTKKDK